MANLDLRKTLISTFMETCPTVIDELHEAIPHDWWSVIYDLVFVQVKYKKTCASLVPWMLTGKNGQAAEFYDVEMFNKL